jgi:hypothetical protein
MVNDRASGFQVSVYGKLALAAREARMSDEAYRRRDTLRSSDAASVAAKDKWPVQ